ncbi:hypothetical protein J2741_001521 [Methanolinea mesophila]|uniref:hypothetical protein n=1 Tax=Methanolinea mesophila TaxID=547055 RepID=UPI001AE5A46F|nr:hypothetical protein [Methanolinea mesophila]MBP1928974.1 hypothetical protein [Methanolinea mesophila]
MQNIEDFTLKDMVEFSAALRTMGTGADSMEEVAHGIVNYLHDNLVDQTTGERNCVLVRFFKTVPYGELDADLQEFARGVLKGSPESPDMKCLVLLASAGAKHEWNSRKNSVGHKAIPLPSGQFIEAFPMIAQIIQQMGLELNTLIRPDPEVLLDMSQTTYNVFYVPEAVGSRYVPAQEDFVIPCGVRSVIGFGGVLPSGNLFVTNLFSRVPVPKETADMFRTLALSVKVAILPFYNTVFRESE